jgi:hypothetical protein
VRGVLDEPSLGSLADLNYQSEPPGVVDTPEMTEDGRPRVTVIGRQVRETKKHCGKLQTA